MFLSRFELVEGLIERQVANRIEEEEFAGNFTSSMEELFTWTSWVNVQIIKHIQRSLRFDLLHQFVDQRQISGLVLFQRCGTEQWLEILALGRRTLRVSIIENPGKFIADSGLDGGVEVRFQIRIAFGDVYRVESIGRHDGYIIGSDADDGSIGLMELMDDEEPIA